MYEAIVSWGFCFVVWPMVVLCVFWLLTDRDSESCE